MIRNLEWHAANGDIIYFGAAAPFMLENFYPGTPSATPEITKSVRVAGQTTFYVTADSLTPSMEGTLIASGATASETQKNLDNLRRRLQAALNPLHFGTLIFNNNAGSWRLRCRPVAGATFGARFANTHKIDIDWTSDDPYWTERDERTLEVGTLTKMWTFPWVIMPTVFGLFVSRGPIENDTLIGIYPKIVVSATESESVTVGNETTGDFVTIQQSIGSGDELELDMAAPTVTLITEDGERRDVTHWTTPGSVFPWALPPGTNEVYASVENPELSPIVKISWRRPQEGI